VSGSGPSMEAPGAKSLPDMASGLEPESGSTSWRSSTWLSEEPTTSGWAGESGAGAGGRQGAGVNFMKPFWPKFTD
jgi:hypothetical protein